MHDIVVLAHLQLLGLLGFNIIVVCVALHLGWHIGC